MHYLQVKLFKNIKKVLEKSEISDKGREKRKQRQDAEPNNNDDNILEL